MMYKSTAFIEAVGKEKRWKRRGNEGRRITCKSNCFMVYDYFDIHLTLRRTHIKFCLLNVKQVLPIYMLAVIDGNKLLRVII